MSKNSYEYSIKFSFQKVKINVKSGFGLCFEIKKIKYKLTLFCSVTEKRDEQNLKNGLIFISYLGKMRIGSFIIQEQLMQAIKQGLHILRLEMVIYKSSLLVCQAVLRY